MTDKPAGRQVWHRTDAPGTSEPSAASPSETRRIWKRERQWRQRLRPSSHGRGTAAAGQRRSACGWERVEPSTFRQRQPLRLCGVRNGGVNGRAAFRSAPAAQERTSSPRSPQAGRGEQVALAARAPSPRRHRASARVAPAASIETPYVKSAHTSARKAAGASSGGQWPQPGSMAMVAPGMRPAMARLSAGGVA